jgi:plastocyanin domain-containing protein
MKRILISLVLGVLPLTAFASVEASASKPREQRIAITVTKNGFEPAIVVVKTGRPVVLVVTRKVKRTCATDIVLKDLGIKKPLPLNKPVEVRFTPHKAGTIRYACAMDMVAGKLVVE